MKRSPVPVITSTLLARSKRSSSGRTTEVACASAQATPPGPRLAALVVKRATLMPRAVSIGCRVAVSFTCRQPVSSPCRPTSSTAASPELGRSLTRRERRPAREPTRLLSWAQSHMGGTSRSQMNGPWLSRIGGTPQKVRRLIHMRPESHRSETDPYRSSETPRCAKAPVASSRRLARVCTSGTDWAAT
jgi:hypothetical protein